MIDQRRERMMSETVKLKASIISEIEKMSVHELAALKELAVEKHNEKLEAAKQALIAEFSAKASELGVSLDALLPGHAKSSLPKAPKTDATKAPIKYRGPNGEEWSGRGRLPTWLSKFESDGRTRDEFLLSRSRAA